VDNNYREPSHPHQLQLSWADKERADQQNRIGPEGQHGMRQSLHGSTQRGVVRHGPPDQRMAGLIFLARGHQRTAVKGQTIMSAKLYSATSQPNDRSASAHPV
jgi:hypothetical protein